MAVFKFFFNVIHRDFKLLLFILKCIYNERKFFLITVIKQIYTSSVHNIIFRTRNLINKQFEDINILFSPLFLFLVTSIISHSSIHTHNSTSYIYIYSYFEIYIFKQTQNSVFWISNKIHNNFLKSHESCYFMV